MSGRWTPEEVEKLLEYRDLDVTFDRIANVLGRSPAACRTKYYNTKGVTNEGTNIIKIGNLQKVLKEEGQSMKGKRLRMVGRYILKEKGLEGPYVVKTGKRIVLSVPEMEATFIVWIQPTGLVQILQVWS